MGTFLVYKVYLKIDLEEKGGESLEMIKLPAHWKNNKAQILNNVAIIMCRF